LTAEAAAKQLGASLAALSALSSSGGGPPPGGVALFPLANVSQSTRLAK